MSRYIEFTQAAPQLRFDESGEKLRIELNGSITLDFEQVLSLNRFITDHVQKYVGDKIKHYGASVKVDCKEFLQERICSNCKAWEFVMCSDRCKGICTNKASLLHRDIVHGTCSCDVFTPKQEA
jgi:hypothetical protein